MAECRGAWASWGVIATDSRLRVALKPVHTGDYSRRFRRQFVAENGDCRRKVRLSPNSATVAVFSPFSATVDFSATVWTGLYDDDDDDKGRCPQNFTIGSG